MIGSPIDDVFSFYILRLLKMPIMKKADLILILFLIQCDGTRKRPWRRKYDGRGY